MLQKIQRCFQTSNQPTCSYWKSVCSGTENLVHNDMKMGRSQASTSVPSVTGTGTVGQVWKQLLWGHAITSTVHAWIVFFIPLQIHQIFVFLFTVHVLQSAKSKKKTKKKNTHSLIRWILLCAMVVLMWWGPSGHSLWISSGPAPETQHTAAFIQSP